MTTPAFKTPIAFFIFRRADTAERVLQVIAKVKPEKLFIIADGPRAGRLGEEEACDRTRALVDRIDWDCDVVKDFSAKNQGIRHRIPTGLDWVFRQVDEAVILEDDCVPKMSFFPFCESLLHKYRHDTRVGQISGFRETHVNGPNSYHFSLYARIWGWATWRRAWQQFDDSMHDWPALSQNGLLDHVLGRPEQKRFWAWFFQRSFEGRLVSWDYRWQYALWRQGMLSASANINLVQNIGFGPEATHTRRTREFLMIESKEMIFPLRHPPLVTSDPSADAALENGVYRSSFAWRFRSLVKDLAWMLRGLFVNRSEG